jgi:hypothetical protein
MLACVLRAIWSVDADRHAFFKTLRDLTRLNIDRENAMKLKSTANKGTQTTKTNKPATKGGSVLKVKSKVKSGGNVNSLGKH